MVRSFTDGLVSVIIPVYNSEKYICQTIQSVLNQTYTNLEIVLVDDCSSDKSGELIKTIAKNNSNVIYKKLDSNCGAAVARNKALEIARGQYVAFLDADDVWYPDKIERQLDLLREKDGCFAYSAIEMIDGEDKIIKKKRKIKETISYKYLLKNTAIATSSVLIDRKVIGDFRMPNRRGGQDYATWLMLLKNNILAYGINETLVKYRTGNNKSLSRNKFKSIKQVWEIQRRQEKINLFSAWINVHFFVFNAFKKHFIK